MSPLVSRLRLASAVLLGFAPFTVSSRTAGAADATLEVILPQSPTPPYYTVTRVDPDGTIRLGISDAAPPTFRRLASGFIAEGYYLLLPSAGTGGRPRAVLRVEVTEVAEGPTLTLRTTPEAAARVKAGDGASLVRPPGSTTALLRSLPGEVPFAPDAAGQPGAERARQQAISVRNLRQIGLAMHNFHSTFNKFPAATIYGPDGKPWHSWRVLILPYIEQAPLFNEYDFNQPWDSETNLKLLDRMPSVYRDPVHGDDKGHFTHYAALVGPHAAFPPSGAKQSAVKNSVPIGQGGRGIAEILDGTANTWTVAPVDPGRKIPWTKPEDITVGPDFPGLGKPGGIATPYTLGNRPGAAGVAPVLYADGSVRLISATIEPALLKALLTVDGGENIPVGGVPQDRFPPTRPPGQTLKVRVADGKATATVE